MQSTITYVVLAVLVAVWLGLGLACALPWVIAKARALQLVATAVAVGAAAVATTAETRPRRVARNPDGSARYRGKRSRPERLANAHGLGMAVAA